MRVKPAMRRLTQDTSSRWLLVGLTLGAGNLGVSCAASQAPPSVEIRVQDADPSPDQDATVGQRQPPPGGAWWTASSPCEDAAEALPVADPPDYDAFACRLPDGTNHGWFTSWYENHRLQRHGHYDHGARDRVWYEWSATGELTRQDEYLADKLHGRSRSWGPRGVLLADCNYERGTLQGFCAEFYVTGAPRRHTWYLAGTPHGEFESFLSNGSTQDKGRYVNGVRDGEWLMCDDKSCNRGEFKNGVESGVWTAQDSDGVTLSTEDYSVPGQRTRIDYCQGHPCKRTVYVWRP
ncbi:MAG: toxin-antitoxin system YwqK family antitoxin [Polyangiaceae bacterium]